MHHTCVLEFVLLVQDVSRDTIKQHLADYAEHLDLAVEIEQNQVTSYKIRLTTRDPELIFDICAQFGRIRSVRVTDDQRVL